MRGLAAARNALRPLPFDPASVMPISALQMAVESGCAWMASAWFDVRACPGWAQLPGDHEPGGQS